MEQQTIINYQRLPRSAKFCGATKSTYQFTGQALNKSKICTITFIFLIILFVTLPIIVNAQQDVAGFLVLETQQGWSVLKDAQNEAIGKGLEIGPIRYYSSTSDLDFALQGLNINDLSMVYLICPETHRQALENSLKSEKFNFKGKTTYRQVESPTRPFPPKLKTPPDGAVNIPIDNIEFTWEPIKGIDQYVLELSKSAELQEEVGNLEFKDPIDRLENVGATCKYSMKLDWSTTYYWRVKAMKPIEGEWNLAVFSFTTMAEPITSEPMKPRLSTVYFIAPIIVGFAIGAIVALYFHQRQHLPKNRQNH